MNPNAQTEARLARFRQFIVSQAEADLAEISENRELSPDHKNEAKAVVIAFAADALATGPEGVSA